MRAGLAYKAKWISVLFATVMAYPPGSAASDPGTAFPLRSEYKEVATIGTTELAKRFDRVTIIDVRSKYEYDTLHIKGAVLAPISDTSFVDTIRQLRGETDRPLVFYCNGITCRKSYDAARLAHIYYVPNTYVYDAGIAEWAQKQPERSVLLGKTPIEPKDLVSDAQLKARFLDPKAFQAKVSHSAIVLDVRDTNQRRSSLFPGEQWAALDDHQKLNAILESALRDKKTLMIYDQVGRQVQWFQYYLQRKGVSDYYFMRGGAENYLKTVTAKSPSR